MGRYKTIRNEYDFHRAISKGVHAVVQKAKPFTKTENARLFVRINGSEAEFLADEERLAWTNDPLAARDFTGYSVGELAGYYSDYTKQDKSEHHKFGFVDIAIEHKFTPVPMDSPELVDALRRKALHKLSIVEIQALGAEHLAIYYKLKEHGIDDDDE